jgi:iron complex outermembrane receptor protein
MAPLNTSLALEYTKNKWQISGEIIAYDSQDKVSTTNLERRSAGYAIANLTGSYMFNKTANISFGINNIFDRKYFDHLGGFNRNNLNTDVGFNANDIRTNKLPSIGINLYATLYLHW